MDYARGAAALLFAVSPLGLAMPALAQEGAVSVTDGNALGDIVVTARKRSETSISVPVTVTAFDGQRLSNLAIVSIDSVARIVPGLIIGEGGTQGGIVALRGIAGSDANPLADQAVSFEVDGVQIARAGVRRMAEMDMATIEVLKGPQALFFGKNSPAGVISIKTADPGDHFEAGLSTGYEFDADEVRAEGFAGGPIGKTLGLRVAGFYSRMLGWADNIGPESGPDVFPARYRHAPHQRDMAGRITLKWEPSDSFDARLKLTYGELRGDTVSANFQLVNCPRGAPQGSLPIDDCKADGKTSTGGVGPNFGNPAFPAYDPVYGDGTTFLRQDQFVGGLEVTFRPSDVVTLTSVTGYYDLKVRNLSNFTDNFFESGAPPRQILASFNFVDVEEFSEELRLATEFDGPFNLLAGGYFQSSRSSAGSVTHRNALNPVFINNYLFRMRGSAWSLFAQANYDILPTLELSAGGRYSYESKRVPNVLSATAAAPRTLTEIEGIDRKDHWNDFSPEVTLSYRPTDRLTTYASYKKGFLSGGYSALAPQPGVVPNYDQETIRGFEAGVKAALAGNRVRMNLSIYSFKVRGLQVTTTIQGTQQELRNVGAATTKGAEFDMTWITPIDGLRLSGAVAYNRARYQDYQASCYRGQSSASCFQQVNRVTGATALLQDLSGTQLVRAPEWVGNIGFDFRTSLGGGLDLGLAGNASHSDGYFADTTSSPGSRQPGYELFDATIRLIDPSDRWEVALIGRNLGNNYYVARTTDVPFTGSVPGAAAVGILGDSAGAVSRGREVMLRLKLNYGN